MVDEIRRQSRSQDAVSSPKAPDAPAATSQPGSDSPARAPCLALVHRFFVQMHQNEVNYCHWKSNEHVGPAVEGVTDLDLLVDRNQTQALAGVLAQTGFKQFIAPPLRRYPGIEDYLGFDKESGRIVHLHLHYELTLGEAHLKGYHLPWERELLASRAYDTTHRLFVADPAMELVLLLVRGALKWRWRDWIRSAFKHTDPLLGSDFDRELRFLREQAATPDVRHAAELLLGPEVAGLLVQFSSMPNSYRLLFAFERVVRRALKVHRTYSALSAVFRRWLREAQWLFDAINRRYLHVPIPLRRTSTRGGRIIVLLGTDGAGKSSLSRALKSWLGQKLDVVPIYFGSGDGRASLYRMPLVIAHRYLLGDGSSRHGRSAPDDRTKSAPGETNPLSVQQRLIQFARVLWAITLAFERRGKLRRMTGARNRGLIVLCDRFPQAQIEGFNDGPLLSEWHSSKWTVLRWLSAWETGVYRTAELTFKDVVIRLTVAPQVAHARRPEMDIEELSRRVNAVQSLNFSPGIDVYDVNANHSIERVRSRVKELVWQYL